MLSLLLATTLSVTVPDAFDLHNVKADVVTFQGRRALHVLQAEGRPNGRADDQLRRNHSMQYISAPDWPWQRLRKEFPGVYESYVDLEPEAYFSDVNER